MPGGAAAAQQAAATLSALDGFARMLAGGACTTVLCARLCPATGQLTYSSAGHPPAIVVDPDGTRRLLDQATAPPLAATAGADRTEVTTELAPGSTLMLYTDGLVERRAVSIDAGIDAAGRILAAGRAMPVTALADRVVGAVGPRAGTDDVAVLLYRHTAPGTARFARSFAADAGELRPTRTALRDWLAEHAVDEDVVDRAVLAAGEAWTNAAEHGYGLDSDRTVYTTATLSPATLSPAPRGRRLDITVTDLGRWRTPGPPANRGRGILLMKGLCDEVSIDPTPHGTTVCLAITGV